MTSVFQPGAGGGRIETPRAILRVGRVCAASHLHRRREIWPQRARKRRLVADSPTRDEAAAAAAADKATTTAPEVAAATAEATPAARAAGGERGCQGAEGRLLLGTEGWDLHLEQGRGLELTGVG